MCVLSVAFSHLNNDNDVMCFQEWHSAILVIKMMSHFQEWHSAVQVHCSANDEHFTFVIHG